MATRKQVQELLDSGSTYETAARELGIRPGLARMIATGVPADGGIPAPGEIAEGGSAQSLVGPPSFNPTSSTTVPDWVRERARRELKRG